jgi:hypothetical protein
MKHTNVKAIFRGLDGSCGYQANREYELTIRHTQSDNIHIEKYCGGGYVAYGSLVAFLENWDNIRTIKRG